MIPRHLWIYMRKPCHRRDGRWGHWAGTSGFPERWAKLSTEPSAPLGTDKGERSEAGRASQRRGGTKRTVAPLCRLWGADGLHFLAGKGRSWAGTMGAGPCGPVADKELCAGRHSVFSRPGISVPGTRPLGVIGLPSH